MDIREKIGQRLVFGFPGTTIPAEFAALVREYKIGNVILFRYNIESLPQLARLCADIQELVRGADPTLPEDSPARHPLFLQTCVSGLLQTNRICRAHFLRLVDEAIGTFPPGDAPAAISA